MHSAPSLLRLASIIYTLQLACFVVQESLEGGSASQVVLWGLVGQLPVALAATLALRWLLARVAPALSSLSIRAEPALQLLVFAFAPVLRPMPVAARSSRRPFVGPLTRRGPPPSF